MQTSQNTANVRNNTTYMLVVNGVFIALTLVATYLIQIRLPFIGAGGLIHMGNIPLFIGAWLFGRKTGAIAGGIGMGLFDLLSGWVSWAPFTLVIVGLMGYVIGKVEEKPLVKNILANRIIGIILAIIIKIVGYYIAEVILFGNFVAPFGSIPGNIIQVGVAAVISLFLIVPLKRMVK